MKRSQEGKFYLLPKIHKPFSKVTGRPVISNNGTITVDIAQFVIYLEKISSSISNILEDTWHFLSWVKDIENILGDLILINNTY